MSLPPLEPPAVTTAFVIFALATVVWVFRDAVSRDWTRSRYHVAAPAAWWALATLLLWIVFFPWYLAVRSTAPRKSDATSTTALAKRCPRCAEAVQSAARACRFCGHEFIGRPRWGRAILITAAIVVGFSAATAYSAGALDSPLSRVGLNTRDCLTNSFGQRLCGDEAVAFCKRLYDEQLNGSTCRRVLTDAGQHVPQS